MKFQVSFLLYAFTSILYMYGMAVGKIKGDTLLLTGLLILIWTYLEIRTLEIGVKK